MEGLSDGCLFCFDIFRPLFLTTGNTGSQQEEREKESGCHSLAINSVPLDRFTAVKGLSMTAFEQKNEISPAVDRRNDGIFPAVPRFSVNAEGRDCTIQVRLHSSHESLKYKTSYTEAIRFPRKKLRRRLGEKKSPASQYPFKETTDETGQLSCTGKRPTREVRRSVICS